jgi:hypothetical protein
MIENPPSWGGVYKSSYLTPLYGVPPSRGSSPSDVGGGGGGEASVRARHSAVHALEAAKDV